MASGSNNNNSSNSSNNNSSSSSSSSSIQPVTHVFFTPEQYLENQRRLQQHVEILDQFNRRGLENYLQIEADLKRKVAEGEQAKRRMQYLQQLASMRAIAPPPVVNGTVPSQNTSPNHFRFQQAVPDALNVPYALMMSPQDRYITNPSSRDGSQQLGTLPVQSPVSYPPTTAGRIMPQTAQSAPLRPQQVPFMNPNVSPPNRLVQQPTGYKNSSRTTSYSLQQRAKEPADAVPLSSHTEAPSLQPHQPWLSQQTPVSGPSSLSGHEGLSMPGSSQQHYYTTSSSSLAGALGGTSRVVNSSDEHPPPVSGMGTERTVTGGTSSHTQVPAKSASVNHNQSPSNDTQDDSIPVAATFSAMPKDQFRQAQKDFAGMLGKEIEATYSGSGSRFNGHSSVPVTIASDLARTKKSTAAASTSQTTSETHENAPTAPSFAPPINSSGTDGSSGLGSNNPRASGAYNVFSVQKPPDVDYSAKFIQPPSTVQQSAYKTASDAPDSHIPNVSGSGTSPFNVRKQYFVADLNSPPNHVSLSHAGPSSIPPYEGNRFTTPSFDKNHPSDPITPASANKDTLAKDILRALNRSPKKRKASTPESCVPDIDAEPPPTKRPIFEPFPADVPVIVPDIFAMPPAHPVTEDTRDSAKIEEVSETVGEGVTELNTSGPPLRTSAVDNSEVGPLQAVSSGTPTVPDSPPSRSAVESRASSEAAIDTALQPFDDTSAPLFLPTPSPLNTPTPSLRERRDQGTGAASSTLVYRGRQSEKRKFKTRVYVEVPILTPEQRRRYSRLTTDEKVVDSVADERVLHEAQELAALSASRLQKLPCLWNDCDRVANSTDALRSHVRDHAELMSEKERFFPCWWGDCIRRFNQREALVRHLQNHVKKSIYCPYEGCDAHLSHPLELHSHVQSKHPSGGCLKPSVKPFEPPFFPLPPLGEMPGYMVVNLPIQPAPISKERRAKLGPWVAKNCFGSVNLGVPRLNARNQPQRRREGDSEPKLLGDWQDRYDYLDRDTSNIPTFADLETSKATEEIKNGLVLLPEAGLRGPLGEETFTSRADRIRLPAGGKYIIKAENEGRGDSEVPEARFADTSFGFSQGQPQLHLRQSEPKESQPGSTPTIYQDFLGVGEPQPLPQPQPQPEMQLVDLS